MPTVAHITFGALRETQVCCQLVIDRNTSYWICLSFHMRQSAWADEIDIPTWIRLFSTLRCYFILVKNSLMQIHAYEHIYTWQVYQQFHFICLTSWQVYRQFDFICLKIKSCPETHAVTSYQKSQQSFTFCNHAVTIHISLLDIDNITCQISTKNFIKMLLM